MELYLQQSSTHRSSDSLQVYKVLQNQAAVIAGNLQYWGINSGNAKTLAQQEIIALLAFLEQIPASPQRKYKDSVAAVAIRERYERLEKNEVYDNDAMMQIANSANADTIAMGKKIFTESYCHSCHGKEGGGIVGPNLTDAYWLHGGSARRIILSIANGAPEKGMQSFKMQFSPQEIGMLTAFIRSLKGTNPPNAKMAQGIKE